MHEVTLETFDSRRDSEMLLRWLAEPHVARWWGDAARATEHERVRPFLVPPQTTAVFVCCGRPDTIRFRPDVH
jgi:hypothetical protein